MADGSPTRESLQADAKAVYESAKDMNSIAEAQEAVRRMARIAYYTLELIGQKPK